MKTTKFSKEDILKSRKFLGEKDLLVSLLKTESFYTVEQVVKIINEYKGRKV